MLENYPSVAGGDSSIEANTDLPPQSPIEYRFLPQDPNIVVESEDEEAPLYEERYLNFDMNVPSESRKPEVERAQESERLQIQGHYEHCKKHK